MPTSPKQRNSSNDVPEIDLSRRYDVYFWEPAGRAVVYSDVLFKEAYSLFDSDARVGIFIEIEQKNGDSVFLAKQGLIKFCIHGAKITSRVEYRKGTQAG